MGLQWNYDGANGPLLTKHKKHVILTHFVRVLIPYKMLVIPKGRYLARRYRGPSLGIGFLTLEIIVVHHTSLDK